MKRLLSGRTFARRLLASLLAAGLLAWPVCLHTGCEGGTTGVDNPGLSQLPIEFLDVAGDPLEMRGELEVFLREHNPALDSAPLLRIEVEEQVGLKLTSEDFDAAFAQPFSKRGASAKMAAADDPSLSGDTLIRFNLVLRGTTGSGAVAMGLSYNRLRKRFALEGGDLSSVDMLAQPLVRFAASLKREGVHGGLGRIILPGTPFLATLVDSEFVLEGLPEGRFPMRLLDGDGYVYAVRESLDTQAGHAFTAAPDPIARIDLIAPPGFKVEALPPQPVAVGQDIDLAARVVGADSNDSRISFLWRFLERPPVDSARIVDPTHLRTLLQFAAAPGYSLEIAATLGAVTARDTLVLKVGPPAPPSPPLPPSAKFAFPLAGDTLVQGQSYRVLWDYPAASLVRLEAKYNGGGEETWTLVADSLAQAPGQNTYGWAAPVLGNRAVDCILRLLAIPSDSVLGVMPAPFWLLPPG